MNTSGDKELRASLFSGRDSEKSRSPSSTTGSGHERTRQLLQARHEMQSEFARLRLAAEAIESSSKTISVVSDKYSLYKAKLVSAAQTLKSLKSKMENDDKYIYYSFALFTCLAGFILVRRLGILAISQWFLLKCYTGSLWLKSVVGFETQHFGTDVPPDSLASIAVSTTTPTYDLTRSAPVDVIEAVTVDSSGEVTHEASLDIPIESLEQLEACGPPRVDFLVDPSLEGVFDSVTIAEKLTITSEVSDEIPLNDTIESTDELDTPRVEFPDTILGTDIDAATEKLTLITEETDEMSLNDTIDSSEGLRTDRVVDFPNHSFVDEL